jgi:TonB family protein
MTTQFGERVTSSESYHWKVDLADLTDLDPDTFIDVETPPKVKESATPVYPREARDGGIEGDVWVKVLVNKDGRVEQAFIMKDSGLNVGFENAALQGAVDTTWEPALVEGKPVALWVAYEIAFKLGHQEVPEGDVTE